ncbi:hypothetical protein E2542_SST27792 [Spatholobus suberectus]|nr:hypothetical protein E2542_SST27792 [Spatholobus suberectus]
MHTLQRSSFSFRRQGSSGRIWQDHIQFVEPKANGTASATSSTRKNNYKEENVSQMEGDIMGRRLHDNNEGAPQTPSLSKTQNKVGLF